MKPSESTLRRPVLLVILDGFGTNPSKINNAVEAANTPNLDQYFSHHNHTLIQASGTAVGLPDGQMGNSEVGHTIIGSGNIIQQDIVKIAQAIKDKSFYRNPALLKAMHTARDNNRPIHLLGLASDGGVHSHIDHLHALIELAAQEKVKPLLHLISDGRDTPPQSILRELPRLEQKLQQAGGAIVSIVGRYYAMDRDRRWERTELAWRMLMTGGGRKSPNARMGVESAYAAGQTDEFIKPVILPGFQPLDGDDQVIFFNFRKDRPRQLAEALAISDFSGFDRGNIPMPQLTTLMPYNAAWDTPSAFVPEKPIITLGEILSRRGIHQFHCAETEKYPHVTYFFNGGKTDSYDGETQKLIPSPKVATYDLKPEMSADKVSDTMIEAIQSGDYGFLVVNFANGDMVGHTAKPKAVIQAVEALDREVGRLLDVAVEHGYSVILTADHGNCEEMIDAATGEPHTQHTTYPVPCLIIDQSAWQLSSSGGLANIAPTVLHLMAIEIPEQMQAGSLLLKEIRHFSGDHHHLGSVA